MYLKFEEETGRYFTYFKKERKVKGQLVEQTEKSVFGLLSESVKTGTQNGKPLYDYDYWNGIFCGKALQLAKTLKNKDRILVKEMTVRNHINFPSIMVTQFEIIPRKPLEEEEFMDVPDDEELLFS